MEKSITIKKDTVICIEGDDKSDLYYVQSGKLLICSRSGKMVTPIAHVNAGEYFGELSFFDNLPRSADVITVENTNLLKIPQSELKIQFPTWLLITAKQLTKKIRLFDTVISENGIKRQNVETMKPLSIEDQRRYYELIVAPK
jgi:CRP/FNR family cyclic AMP-dependent transcriptional regulator